jgi:hypothetical protein
VRLYDYGEFYLIRDEGGECGPGLSTGFVNCPSRARLNSIEWNTLGCRRPPLSPESLGIRNEAEPPAWEGLPTAFVGNCLILWWRGTDFEPSPLAIVLPP